MSTIIRARFEKGVFRPIDPIPELSEGAAVILAIRKPLNLKAIRKYRGILTAKEADKMRRLIQEGRRVEGNW